MKTCDAIFAVITGVPPDEGVCIELGIAIALGKPTFLFRDDFRRVCDSQSFACNLMLYAGLPTAGWQEYVYTSIPDITRSDKALTKWVKEFCTTTS